MPELNWNPVAADSSSHFAPFPSISPSPNLFSQDFGSFDFPTSMFGDMHGAGGSSISVSSSSQVPVSSHSSSTTTTTKQQQQRKDQRGGYEVNMQPHQQLQHNQPPPQPQEFHDQQSGQQHIFDANFFSATVPGTLTPPSVAAIYPTQDEGYINFSGTYIFF